MIVENSDSTQQKAIEVTDDERITSSHLYLSLVGEAKVGKENSFNKKRGATDLDDPRPRAKKKNDVDGSNVDRSQGGSEGYRKTQG